MTDILAWRQIADRVAATELQHFTCTTDHPRTPGGRKLPHPRPWEWEVQRYLRQAAQWYQPDDVLLVGQDTNGAIAAAAHLQIDQGNALVEVFIAALAVSQIYRSKGGTVADQTFHQIRDIAAKEARGRGLTVAIVTGKIHRENRASQYLALRAGQEPVSAPQLEYGLWRLQILLD